MITRKHGSRILLYEALGFLAIILLSWLDELIDLPCAMFGGAPSHCDFHEGMMETVVILIAATPIFLLSRRLVSRLFYLEKFLKICAWCKRVDAGDRWVPMDMYLAAGYGQKTTHGMCPDCYTKIKGEPS